MRYGVAVWNFCEERTRLAGLVREFAGFGFDAVSFLPGQIVPLGEEEERELRGALDDHGLAATVHGNFDMTRADVERIVAALGKRLLAITMDAAMAADSRGYFYDAARMARLLVEIDSATRGAGVVFGVEDFPLDPAALEFYRGGLGPALPLERLGTLVDLGHANIRRSRGGYFKGIGPAEQISRLPLPVIEVHVHDNAGDRDAHAPLGDGSLPVDEAARGLAAAGFDGVSTIEIAPGFHGSTPAESKPRARESLERWRRAVEDARGRGA